MIFIKIVFIVFFNTFYAFLILLLKNFFVAEGIICIIFLVHLLLLTVVVLYYEEFKYKIFTINIGLTVLGIIMIIVIPQWKFENAWLILLFCLHYSLIHVFYILLIHFFAIFHENKFLQNRIFFVTLSIYFLGNMTLVTVLLILIGVLIMAIKQCKARDRFHSSDSFNVEVYHNDSQH